MSPGEELGHINPGGQLKSVVNGNGIANGATTHVPGRKTLFGALIETQKKEDAACDHGSLIGLFGIPA